MKATTQKRLLPRQRRDGSQDLIGNGRICDGAQTQALPCRSPVDRGNGKLARASAPLAFSSVMSQEAKSFALDGGYGPDARVSRVVTDLVAGAGLSFSERGTHDLKASLGGGIPAIAIE